MQKIQNTTQCRIKPNEMPKRKKINYNAEKNK